MNPRQLGVLSGLFDEIKGKVDDGDLTYDFVRGGLKSILDGRKIIPVGQRPSGRSLVLSKTFAVDGCSAAEKLALVKNKWGRDVFEGYEETQLRLGPFFTEHDSPAVESGNCATFESVRRLTLMECAQELLDTGDTDLGNLEGDLIHKGITFSIKQVVEILKGGLVSADRRGVIFFVHNVKADQVAVAFMSHIKNALYGKDPDDNYAYVKGVQVVSRTLPPHLRSEE